MYNIFQQKNISKGNSKEKLFSNEKVIIDFREKNSLVPSELMKQKLNIEFKQLKVADYVINGTAIERKSLNDFVQSIINGRLFNQLEEIKQYPSPLLIIEGNLQKKTRMHPHALKGTLLSIALNHKVPILFSENEKETARYITLIANKKSKTISLNPTKKTLNKNQKLQFILESFPNIGPTKAKKLLSNFRSLKKIFNASEKNLNPILGKKSEEFKKILDTNYSLEK